MFLPLNWVAASLVLGPLKFLGKILCKCSVAWSLAARSLAARFAAAWLLKDRRCSNTDGIGFSAVNFLVGSISSWSTLAMACKIWSTGSGLRWNIGAGWSWKSSGGSVVRDAMSGLVGRDG